MDKYLIVVTEYEYQFIKDEGTLEQLQNLVGGYIESVRGDRLLLPNMKKFDQGDTDLMAWINEEGKIMDLEVSMLLGTSDHIYDVLVGPIVLCNSLGPDTFGFNEYQLEYISKQLSSAGYCYIRPDKVEK